MYEHLTRISHEVRCGTVEHWHKKSLFSLRVSSGEVFKGEQRMAFIIFGIAIGALCALFRYRVLMIVPLSCLLAAAAALNGMIIHAHVSVIATEVLGGVVALQFMYVSVSVTRHLVGSKNMVLEVQTAIGKELRTELEVPRNLPPELSALVTQLRLA
jgi:hypothetical protein